MRFRVNKSTIFRAPNTAFGAVRKMELEAQAMQFQNSLILEGERSNFPGSI